MGKLRVIFYFLILISLKSNANLDSLNSRLKNAKNDTLKLNILYKASLNKKYSPKTSDSLFNVVGIFGTTNKSCFIKSYSYLLRGKYFTERDDNLDNNKALKYIMRAIAIGDSCNDLGAIMESRHLLALLNKVTKNFKTAIFNSHLSLKYARQLKDSSMMASNYTLLGNMYKTDMLLDSALYYHNNALKIRIRINNPAFLALTYNNLGLVYKNMNEYEKALFNLRKSLEIKLKIKDKTVHSAYNNMSIVFSKMKSFDSAIYYANKVVQEGIRLKKADPIKQAAEILAGAYEAKKDYFKGMYYYKRYIQIDDSMNKKAIDEQFQEMQAKYESDKKDSELRLKEESLKTSEALNSRKNILIILSSIAFLMAIIASVFIFRSYKQSKQNAESLKETNKIIEEKNKEITDSITYAQNIQAGLLSSEKVFRENLKDYFIFYLPKDIVSGDFYWAQKTKEGFLIMCADCTGHGVPGAFMSLMGIGYLKEIVNQKQVYRPDLILNELRDKIVEGFSNSKNKDGMDASLVKLNGLQLQVSAANNSIWIIRDNENIVVKPDKFPIGKHYGESSPFTLTTLELKENDLVLLYTDGYADQFGGPQNKKHKYKAIEKLILDNHHLPMDKLRELLKSNLYDWKGKNEQVDDILVIGFRA